jgi:hypothetical protein
MLYSLGNGTSGVPWTDSTTFQYGDTYMGLISSKVGTGTRLGLYWYSTLYTQMTESGFSTYGNLSVGSIGISNYRILSSDGFGTEEDHIALSQPQNGTRKASMVFKTNYSAGLSYDTARIQAETYVAGGTDRNKLNFWASNGIFSVAPTIVASITCKSNLLIGTPTEDIADSNTIYIPNGTAPTVALAGGGKLYVEGGALKYIGSSGTISVIAPA